MAETPDQRAIIINDTLEFLILAGLTAVGSIALAAAGQTNLAGAIGVASAVFLIFAYTTRRKK